MILGYLGIICARELPAVKNKELVAGNSLRLVGECGSVESGESVLSTKKNAAAAAAAAAKQSSRR
jgi:hypothetical protein